MSLRDSFVSGGADLEDFFRSFRLDLAPFLRVLRSTRSIATGVQVAHFMAGRWRHEKKQNPKALVLDVICHSASARSELRRMLARAGYSVADRSCCHNLGEWKGIPSDKRTCMVQGVFGQRAVHVIELPRPVVQTVLSRVYGSMAGTYITGGGRAVSLFPHMTFVERRWWVPKRYSAKARTAVGGKYGPWEPVPHGEGRGAEMSSSSRTVSDELCWSLSFNPGSGALLHEQYDCTPTQRPNEGGHHRLELGPDMLLYARQFPSMRASMNANGGVFDPEYWLWTK